MHRSKLKVLSVPALTLVASAFLLAPKPAEAWWRYGPGWHGGWGYARCCYAPRIYVALPGRVVVGGPVWVPAHWNGLSWVGGHWR